MKLKIYFISSFWFNLFEYMYIVEYVYIIYLFTYYSQNGPDSSVG